MKKTQKTLQEVNQIFAANDMDYLLTRYAGREYKVDDLDILVDENSYNKAIDLFKSKGYAALSHDHALGGRIANMQKNLVKEGRVKIDLHRDFTWRKSRYFDLNLVWNSSVYKVIGNVRVKAPAQEIDTFIVLVNILFEKSYILNSDLVFVNHFQELDTNQKDIFRKQSMKYAWNISFNYIDKWIYSYKFNTASYPVFVPAHIILLSYVEKFFKQRSFDVVSFFYYIFFRLRYRLNNKLPYT